MKTVIKGIFKSEKDFEVYQKWIKENGYTYEQSFDKELINEFRCLYYGYDNSNTENKLANLPEEELIELFVSNIRGVLKEVEFNPLYNNKLIMVLFYDPIKNIEIYDSTKRGDTIYTYLVKEDQPEVYKCIVDDIMRNGFKHKVEMINKTEESITQ